jgi:D-tyrosyl-tRNA(Tyr) deacylase
MRLIVTSHRDIAGKNIYNELAKNFGFKEKGEFEGMPIYEKGEIWLISTEKSQTQAEHLDGFFDPEFYVFASRHKSESGEKTLTVHATGNLTSEAKVGGRPEKLSIPQPAAMKVALRELYKANKDLALGYRVSMEATHHGPTDLQKPLLFVEVGSTVEEWEDKKAIRAVARAVLNAARNRQDFPRAIGIGGTHYAPIHTKIMLESDVAIGHIIPSYSVLDIRREVFQQAIKKTGALFGLLDWKGMKKEHRVRAKKLAEEVGLELKRGKDLAKKPVLPEFEIEEEFFKEAEKIDRKKIESLILEKGGVVIRDKDGKLKNKFQAKEDIRSRVIKACFEILKKKYQIKIDGTYLILREMKFDPDKARMLGIKDGPLFGKLARGNSVKLEGREITPEMVVKVKEKRIKIKDEEIFKYI